MNITLNESNKDTLIGKYIKCFQYTDSDSGDICYTLDEPFGESAVVYRYIYSIKTIGVFIFLKFEVSDLEIYYTDEIDIFDINPVSQFVSLDL